MTEDTPTDGPVPERLNFEGMNKQQRARVEHAMSPSGIIVIDKPLHRTSMDVCRVVRRRFVNNGYPKRIKVGHGGTLDPLATGVLVVLVGKATKRCDEVMAGQKVYEAEIDLSGFSNTDDLEGVVEPVDCTPVDEARVREVLPGFVGEIMQAPPIYSAIWVDGKRAYDLARKGKIDELPKRPVRIDGIEVKAFVWPKLTVEVACGKGVYIRSLARDMGVALGCGGYLTGLRRTRVGVWTIEMARPLEALPEKMGAGDISANY